MIRFLALICGPVMLVGCDGAVIWDKAPTRSISSPAGQGSQLPHLANLPDGRVVLSWVANSEKGHSLIYSMLNDRPGEGVWTPPKTVSSGSDWFINWADFPSVVPITGDLWAAHWLRLNAEGRFAYDVVISLSKDGGRTWSAAVVPHRDNTPTEHGFVSLFPLRDAVGVAWLDGRRMAPESFYREARAGRDGKVGMSLRTLRMTSARLQTRSTLVDGLTCDCCQTDATSVDGHAILVYRNRTSDEIRDIYLVREAGEGWSDPMPVARDGWKINGCPVNGPAVASQGMRVVVAWYTQAEDNPRVRAAISLDAGESFSAPVSISTEAPLGRVDVVVLPDNRFVVSWLERLKNRDRSAGIFIRDVSPEGVLNQPLKIAETQDSRLSGFPQIAADDSGNLILAWTDLTAGGVRTVRITDY